MFYRNLFFLIFIFLFNALSALSGQLNSPLLISPPGSQNFNKAIRLERDQRYDEAIEIYQSLLRRNPKNTRAYLQLKSLFRHLEMHNELEELIRMRLSQFPSDLQSHVDLGETFFLQGDKQKAFEYWTNTRDLFAYSQTIYRLLMQVYINHQLEQQLNQLISEGRKRFNDPTLFSMELGQLYYRKQNYQKAGNEFITYIIYKPKRKRQAHSQLLRIANEPDGLPIVENILATRMNENETVIRSVLSDVYFVSSQYKKAFIEQELLGMNSFNDFKRWLQFANNLRRENQFTLSLESYSKVLNTIPDIFDNKSNQYNKLVGEALYGLALTYEKQIIPLEHPASLAEYFPNNLFFEDHFYGVPTVETIPMEESFALYDSILVNMPASTFSPQAHFRIGEIKYRITRDFDGALNSYRSARSSSGNRDFIRKCNERIFDVFVAKGDLTGANDFINSLLSKAVNDKEIKSYQLKKSCASFLSGEIDSTLNLLGDFVATLNFADDYLNDVLELKGFIEENYIRASDEGKTAFSLYLNGERLLRQYKLIEAKSFFNEVVTQYPNSLIADDAAFRRAKIQVLLGDYEESIKRLITYQESPIGDKVITQIGEVYDYYLNSEKEAIQWYLIVLEQYPHSMLAEPVRYRIRELTKTVEIN